jgi:hypothetical protein
MVLFLSLVAIAIADDRGFKKQLHRIRVLNNSFVKFGFQITVP